MRNSLKDFRTRALARADVRRGPRVRGEALHDLVRDGRVPRRIAVRDGGRGVRLRELADGGRGTARRRRGQHLRFGAGEPVRSFR